MVKELNELLDNTTLSMTFSKKGDKISVTVIPKSKKDSSKSLSNTPLLICGTAAEIDANLTKEIQKAIGDNVGFFSNAEAVSAAIKEDAPTANAGKTTAAKSSSTGSAPVKETKKEFKPNATQKKAMDKAKASFEKAEKDKDPDMREYLRKQSEKMYVDAKMPQEEIDELNKRFAGIKGDGAVQGDAFKEQTNDSGSEEADNDEGGGNEEEETDKTEEEDNDNDEGSAATLAPDDDIF